MAVGIYTITSPSNRVYVGQSWDLDRRQEDYLRGRCKSQTRMCRSIDKYGWEAHKFEVVLELREDISQATLDCWEEYFYDLYKANHDLLNLKLPGSHGTHSEETREKLRVSGKTLIGEKNPMFGRKHTEESRKKMSESSTGKYIGLQAGEKHHMWGKKHSEESKRKNSNSLKRIGHKPPDGCQVGSKNGKFLGWILVYKNTKFIGRFEGVRVASEYTTVYRGGISKILNGGKYNTLKGYIFIREPLQK